LTTNCQKQAAISAKNSDFWQHISSVLAKCKLLHAKNTWQVAQILTGLADIWLEVAVLTAIFGPKSGGAHKAAERKKNIESQAPCNERDSKQKREYY
jgi:hypothetical protein